MIRYQEHSNDTNVHISVKICDNPYLDLSEKSSYVRQSNLGKRQGNR